MSSKLALLKQGAVKFVRAGNAADEYLLIDFKDRPQAVLPFTMDLDRVTHPAPGFPKIAVLVVEGHCPIRGWETNVGEL
jgi:hypothetical protein